MNLARHRITTDEAEEFTHELADVSAKISEVYRAANSSTLNAMTPVFSDIAHAIWLHDAAASLEKLAGRRAFMLKDAIDLEKTTFEPKGKNADERKAHKAAHFEEADQLYLQYKDQWMDARHELRRMNRFLDWLKVDLAISNTGVPF